MSGSGAIRALAKEKHVRAVVRQYLIYHDMHKTVRHFDGESSHMSTVAFSTKPARKVSVEANQSNHARVVQFSGLSDVSSRRHDGRSMQNTDDPLQRFCTAFDTGDVVLFFSLWKSFLAPEARAHTQIRELEFLVRLHFAIFPFRRLKPRMTPHRSDEDLRMMEQFNEYLQRSAANIGKASNKLEFYALPYLDDPRDHPSFAPLFTQRWLQQLRSKLQSILSPHLTKAAARRPDIYTLLQWHRRTRALLDQQLLQDIQALAQIGDRALQLLQKNYDSLPASGRPGVEVLTWVEETRSRVRSTKQRVNTFVERWTDATSNSSALAHPNTPEFRQSSSHQSTSRQSTSHQSTSHQFDDKAKEVLLDEAVSTSDIQAATMYSPKRSMSVASFTTVDLVPLDYCKIAAELLALISAVSSVGSKEDIKRCCLLLQALRWRLCRAGSQRGVVMRELVTADVLGITPKVSHIGLMSAAAICIHKSIREYFFRFVNRIASETKGRRYLLSRAEATLPLLVRLLKTEPGDTAARQNALGILQKCSLHFKAQRIMVNLDVINWVVQILRYDLEEVQRTGNGMSMYTTEYALALLANLCMRSCGKNKAEHKDVRIMDLLASLLDIDDEQMRGFVHSILYSILSRKSLRLKAHEMGLSARLTSMMPERGEDGWAEEDEMEAKKIQYILRRLRTSGDAQMSSESAEEEEDEEDEDDERDGDEFDDYGASDDEFGELIFTDDADLQGEPLLRSEWELSSYSYEVMPSRDPSDDDDDADIQFSPVASPSTSLTNRESFLEPAATLVSDPNPQDTSEATLHPDHTLDGRNRDARGDAHVESTIVDSSQSPVMGASRSSMVDSARSYLTTDSNYSASDTDVSDGSYIEVKSINYSAEAKVKPANHKPEISEAFVVTANRESANGFAVSSSIVNERDADAVVLTSTNRKPASNVTAAASTNYEPSGDVTTRISTNDKPGVNLTATASSNDKYDQNVTVSASSNDKYASNVTATASTNNRPSDNATATASNDRGNVTASVSTNNKSSDDVTAAKSTYRKSLIMKISDPTPNGKLVVVGASENVIGRNSQVASPAVSDGKMPGPSTNLVMARSSGSKRIGKTSSRDASLGRSPARAIEDEDEDLSMANVELQLRRPVTPSSTRRREREKLTNETLKSSPRGDIDLNMDS